MLLYFIKLVYLSRFGITLSIETTVSLKKDLEIFVSYDYQMKKAPKWYRDLYKEFVKDNPNKAEERKIKIIEEFDHRLTKGPIPIYE